MAQENKVVSSNWTVFLKLFLPVLWIVFFGAMTVLVLVSQPFDASGLFSPFAIRSLFVSFFVTSVGLLYLRTMRLMRVEMHNDYIYVSNYFTTCRYTYDSIESIDLSKVFFREQCVISFHQKTSFGKAIVFLPNHNLIAFLNAHPELTALLKKD